MSPSDLKSFIVPDIYIKLKIQIYRTFPVLPSIQIEIYKSPPKYSTLFHVISRLSIIVLSNKEEGGGGIIGLKILRIFNEFIKSSYLFCQVFSIAF